ncbi:hypothetical protein [Wenzhouxiangella sp. EGI_FJ10305]|uniref:hypothetical protein n=1 Tax=Wenzhouxiangella sp. EGI_FJ10305 TaxID=3243768 RepID=UPI0035E06505
MSTTVSGLEFRTSTRSSASSLTRFVDRWIFVLMAAWFIVITLTGFIPTSLEKIAAVEVGMRPPFPFMLHAHAVLMGALLVLLLVQALLVATGRQQHHQKLGVAGIVIAPALVVVGCLLVPIIHHQVWGMMQATPPEAQAELQQIMVIINNIMLLQIQVGILLAVAPMFIWDLLRTRKVHKAYSLWLAGCLPSSVLIYLLWNTDWWQAAAPRLVGL